VKKEGNFAADCLKKVMMLVRDLEWKLELRSCSGLAIEGFPNILNILDIASKISFRQYTLLC